MANTSERRARQAKIERFAEETARRVEHAERKGPRSDTPDSQLRVILRKCGYKKRSPRVVKEINKALIDRQVVTNPLVTDPEVRFDQRIYFYRSSEPPAPAKCISPNERSLEDFIVMNFGRIDAFSHLDLLKRQYKLSNGQRIDLLCRDSHTRDLVIIELKHDDADQGVVAQLFTYLDAMKQRAVREGVGLRAVLITAERDESLEVIINRLSEATGFRVDWRTYSANIEVPTTEELIR